VNLVGAIAFAPRPIALTLQLPTPHKISHFQIRCTQKQTISLQSAGAAYLNNGTSKPTGNGQGRAPLAQLFGKLRIHHPMANTLGGRGTVLETFFLAGYLSFVGH
jgi:hypothetical protein